MCFESLVLLSCRVWGAGFGLEIAMEGRQRISIVAIYKARWAGKIFLT